MHCIYSGNNVVFWDLLFSTLWFVWRLVLRISNFFRSIRLIRNSNTNSKTLSCNYCWTLMRKIILILIRIYQKLFSPDQGLVSKLVPNMRVCIFTPTCSEYTYQSIEKYGIIRGIWLGAKRLLRCGPWSKGGYDPVP